MKKSKTKDEKSTAYQWNVQIYSLFISFFQPQRIQQNTFQALLIRVVNEGVNQWYLKTYLAALEDNGNDPNSIPRSGDTTSKVAQVRLKVVWAFWRWLKHFK